MNRRARHFAAVDTGVQMVACPEQVYRFKAYGKNKDKFKLSTGIIDTQSLLPYPDIRSAEDFMKNMREIAYLGAGSHFNGPTILSRQIAEGMHYLYHHHVGDLPYTVYNLTMNFKNKAPINYLTTHLDIETNQKIKTTAYTFSDFGLIDNDGFINTPPSLQPVVRSAFFFAMECKKNRNLDKLYPRGVDAKKRDHSEQSAEQFDDGIIHMADYFSTHAERKFNAEINTLGNYIIYMDGYALKKKITDYALYRHIPTWVEVPYNQAPTLGCYHMTSKDYKEKTGCTRISSVSKTSAGVADIFNALQLKYFTENNGEILFDEDETNYLLDMYEHLENEGEDRHWDMPSYWPLLDEQEEAYCDKKYYGIDHSPLDDGPSF